MLVTAQKLDESLHKIRDIDFSAFYREVQFSDPDKGINREMIMKEIMPDIILMPNAGTRSMMWQETAGVRRDTSARFLFPIFTAVDIDDMMVDTVGRYRWEICRKIQGVHWNDIRIAIICSSTGRTASFPPRRRRRSRVRSCVEEIITVRSSSRITRTG